MQEKSYYDDMEKYCRELLNTVWPMFGESPPCADKKKLNVPKEEVCESAHWVDVRSEVLLALLLESIGNVLELVLVGPVSCHWELYRNLGILKTITSSGISEKTSILLLRKERTIGSLVGIS